MSEIAGFLDFALGHGARAGGWALLAGGALALPLLMLAPRAVPLAFAAAFAVFLALSPFPEAAAMACPRPGTEPLLDPFGPVRAAVALARQGAPASAWLTDITLVAAVLNVALFMPAGAALRLVTARAAAAPAFGLALSAGIETAQITGNFGLYPCAYRQFDVGDLLGNALGVTLGFWLADRLARRRARLDRGARAR